MTKSAKDGVDCEIRILGKRHAAVDVEALCSHLDLIVGKKVAEVMINQHMSSLGEEDAQKARTQNPQATAQEVFDTLAHADCMAGIGMTRITTKGDSVGEVDVEISNPCLKQVEGSAKAFLFSYWCGVSAYLFANRFRLNYVVYDEARDLIRCQIVPR